MAFDTMSLRGGSPAPSSKRSVTYCILSGSKDPTNIYRMYRGQCSNIITLNKK